MENWIEFGKGPLFRLAFAVMVLGLLRIFALTAFAAFESLYRAGDRVVPWKDLTKKTLAWLLPFGKIWNVRPLYSSISFLFHIGLILVPLFYSAHVWLWERSTGFGWFSLSGGLADNLTLLTIAMGILLFLGRILHPGSRYISRKQDYLWPLLLVIPFITGYLCANVKMTAEQYQPLMLVHIYSANLILVLMPFTKVAHCILLPISQFIGGISWKFPRDAGDKVAATLGKKEIPV